ncbi:MAG: hypothetical protein QOI84_1885 [Solirubrobacterales bacterium]|nr:hypothetical protein [Solirubrobacterales bacterium]
MAIATVGEDGNWVMHRPSHELGPEDLADTRRLAEPGEGFVIAVGRESSPGVAADQDAMQPILNTKVVKSYAAEWHTSAIEELRALDVDWAQVGSLDDVRPLAFPVKCPFRRIRRRKCANPGEGFVGGVGLAVARAEFKPTPVRPVGWG